MEAIVQSAAEHVALVLEAISILIVAVGCFEALYRSLWPVLRGNSGPGIHRDARLGLARWLLLGLEFMLAADIVKTAIAPDWNAIGQLGAIAAIRTFLNYFLERDREALKSEESPSRH
jgi:uncharacterized membrane protein